jgi:hypothetical protein
MSDIGIRLDGVILAATILLTALAFGAVSLVTMGLAWRSERNRVRWRHLAKTSFGMVAMSIGALVAVLINVDRAPPLPVDIIDWLTVPWLGLAGFVAVRLIRFGRASPGE